MNQTLNNITYNANLTETVVSVKDFGAAGDGVTNDYTTIQNALNSDANKILFPKGVYYIIKEMIVKS